MKKLGTKFVICQKRGHFVSVCIYIEKKKTIKQFFWIVKNPTSIMNHCASVWNKLVRILPKFTLISSVLFYSALFYFHTLGSK